MKKVLLIILSPLLLLLLIFTSCSDDDIFLNTDNELIPLVSFRPDTLLIFDETLSTQSFTMYNLTSRSFSWTLYSDATWLEFDRYEGDMRSDGSTLMQATIIRDELPAGTSKTQIKMKISGAFGLQTLNVSVDN